MPEDFAIEHSDRTYRFYLAAPLFEAWANPRYVAEALYPVLQRHSIGLQNMQLENQGNLGQANLRCVAADSSTSLTLFLDRLEVWTTSLSAHCALPRDAAEELVERVSGAAIASYEAIARWHGRIAQLSAADFLGRFVHKVPTTFGPSLGAAATFYYGADSTSLTSSINLDLSSLVKEGLFVQGASIFDRASMSPQELVDVSEALWAKMFNDLGLHLGAL
jgi:hypothetical protein